MDVLNDVREGRQVVAQEKLKLLRRELGLTRSAMAEMLNTTVITYSTWEKKPKTILWPVSAGRVGRFYKIATKELELLKAQGINIAELMPLHYASTLLAVPQEILMRWYRDGHFKAEDLGILGLWIRRDELKYIRPEGVSRKIR